MMMDPKQDFTLSLLSSPVPVIMEVKSRTGDGHDLLKSRPIPEIVESYEAAGAPCLSVVTGRWFGGNLDLLSEVVAAASVPVLHKDFITRRSQLEESKRRGASAALLTIEVLYSGGGDKLIERTLALGLTPFVEVADPAQIPDSWASECVVAINNKDILSRERGEPCVDRSREMLATARAASPKAIVSASGISTPEVAGGLLAQGFDGLLMGTALLQAASLSGFLNDTMRCAHQPQEPLTWSAHG